MQRESPWKRKEAFTFVTSRAVQIHFKKPEKWEF